MAFIVWTGIEEWLTEAARIDLSEGGLAAGGIQLGAEPAPFRVDYRLKAPRGYVTGELELTATAAGWSRHLHLRHDGDGRWRAEVDDTGNVPGGPWDGSLPDLSEARDVRGPLHQPRRRLHRGPRARCRWAPRPPPPSGEARPAGIKGRIRAASRIGSLP